MGDLILPRRPGLILPSHGGLYLPRSRRRLSPIHRYRYGYPWLGSVVPPPLTWDLPGSQLTINGAQVTRNTATDESQHGGAVSILALTGDGSITFVPSATSVQVQFGFSSNVAPLEPWSMTFGAICSKTAAGLYAVDGGVETLLTTYAVADTIAVSRSGSVLTLLKNGSSLYTFTAPIYGPLRASIHIVDNGASATPTISGSWTSTAFPTTWPSWTDVGANLAVMETHQYYRTDVGGTWDVASSAWASQSVKDAAASIFFVIEDGGDKMVGLTTSPSKVSYPGLNYAVDTAGAGPNTFYVYEGGASPFNAGANSYRYGDVIEIRLAANGTVTYLRNGTVMYTSLVSAAGLTLHPDITFFTSQIHNSRASVTPYLTGAWQ